MPATPESASEADSVTSTGLVTQPVGASSVVTGAVSSMRTVAVLVASVLPAASVGRYSIVVVPSADDRDRAGVGKRGSQPSVRVERRGDAGAGVGRGQVHVTGPLDPVRRRVVG